MPENSFELWVGVKVDDDQSLPLFDEWYLGDNGQLEKKLKVENGFIKLEVCRASDADDEAEDEQEPLTVKVLMEAGDQIWELYREQVPHVAEVLHLVAEEHDLKTEGGDPLPEQIDFGVIVTANLPALAITRVSFYWSDLDGDMGYNIMPNTILLPVTSDQEALREPFEAYVRQHYDLGS